MNTLIITIVGALAAVILAPGATSASSYAYDRVGAPILVPTKPLALVRLSKPEVPFDLDGDGVSEFVAWPTHPDDLAFLAYDKNGNGVIDNGSELIGNHFAKTAHNGFDAINALLVAAGQPRSGAIEEGNPVFAKLLLWNDRNRNGVSEPDELRPARDVLHRIGLSFEIPGTKDPKNSEYKWKGWAEFKTPASDGSFNRPIYDAVLWTATTPQQ